MFLSAQIFYLFPLQYDGAALTIMVQTEASFKEDKFINDFFNNNNKL